MKFILYDAQKLPPRQKLRELLRGLIGGCLSILALLMLSKWANNPFIMAPFGASCVLLFAVSQSPLAQPRNVIFGHLIAAFVGLTFLELFGNGFISTAVAVGIAIFLMQATRCVHPPAGANPLVILLTANQMHYDWQFLLFPVLSGAIVLVLIAYLVNNIFSPTKWPLYWFAWLKHKS